MQKAHNPVPDGKSGPWLRKRHNYKLVDGVVRLTHDARCAACCEKYEQNDRP